MQYGWIEKYCLNKTGCMMDYKKEWEATRYMLDNKMFVLQGQDNIGRPILTIKLEPSYGAMLRQDNKNIIPGYYMNKLHWNSVYLDADVPDDLLKELIDESYEILLNSFSKKKQKEIQSSKKDY